MYTIIGEVKDREKKFNMNETENFLTKANELIRLEEIKKHVFFVFSSGGFQEDVLAFFRANCIMWSTNEKWLDQKL